MSDNRKDWAELRAILYSMPSGADVDRRVLDALQQVWEDPARTHMKSRKLDRWESPTWAPPLLSFTVERHGGVVNGSINAEVQHYVVDVEQEAIQLAATTTRRVGKADLRLDTSALAVEVADAIRAGRVEPWLLWRSPGDVQIKVSVLIPATNRQTTQGRRARFAKAIGLLLEESGWSRASQPSRWART